MARRIIPGVFITLTISLCLTASITHGGDESPLYARTLKSASELDYPPFALVLPNGNADGFSVELLKAVVHEIGLKVEIPVGPWNEIKQKLADGQLDVLPLVSYTPERDRIYDFTVPYLQMHGAIFVRQGETSIKNESDLAGKEAMVMRGDTAHEYAVSKKLTENLILTEDYATAFTLLSKGRHDAVISQYLMGLQLIKKLGLSNIISVSDEKGESLMPSGKPTYGFQQKFCFAVKEGDRELLNHLNEGLAIIFADGTYEKLYDKWFGPILPQKPVSSTEIFKYVIICLVPILLIVLITGIWYLKREVARKTRDLIKEVEERKQIAAEFKKSRDKFRLLYEKAPLGYQSLDENGHLLEVNQKWLDTLGYSRDEVIGKSFADFLAPDWTDHFKENFPRFKSIGEILGIEFEMLRKDGSAILMSINGSISKKPDGSFQQTHCLLEDITDLRKAEAALKKSTLRQEKMIANIGDVIVIIDQHGINRYQSPNIEKWFGWKPEEVVGVAVLDKVHPDDRDTAVKSLNTLFSEPNTTGKMELRYHCRDNSYKWIEFTGLNLLNDPDISGILGNYRDITERKNTEKELGRYHDHLEEMVRERTKDLQRLINTMSGREVRMADLKQTIKTLRAQLENGGIVPAADDPLKQ